MIMCFTGTGNSRLIADRLQDVLGDEIVRLPPGLFRSPKRIRMQVTDGRMIWVMPVHAWGLPTAVVDVMEKGTFVGADKAVHHLIYTCGDDIGNGEQMWIEKVREMGGEVGCVFSVQMPNTYVFMKGFKLDPPEIVESKLESAVQRADDIADLIYAGKKGVVDVVRGKWPMLKTGVFRRWFLKYKMSTKPFHADGRCVGCGKCARNCPFANITMVNGSPVWGDKCTMCSRCYQVCPTNALQYGKATKGKGQYIRPGFSLID